MSYSHLTGNALRLAQQNEQETENERAAMREERFGEPLILYGPPCPAGFITTACRWCNAIIAVPARTEYPLCTKHQRDCDEQDRQAAEHMGELIRQRQEREERRR